MFCLRTCLRYTADSFSCRYEKLSDKRQLHRTGTIILFTHIELRTRFNQHIRAPRCSFSTDIFQCDGCLFVSFCVGAHGWVALLCQPLGPPYPEIKGTRSQQIFFLALRTSVWLKTNPPYHKRWRLVHLPTVLSA